MSCLKQIEVFTFIFFVGIGVCLFSYGGIVRAGFIADSCVLKDGEHDLKCMMDGFHQEVKDLAKIFGIPEYFLFRDD